MFAETRIISKDFNSVVTEGVYHSEEYLFHFIRGLAPESKCVEIIYIEALRRAPFKQCSLLMRPSIFCHCLRLQVEVEIASRTRLKEPSLIPLRHIVMGM